MLRTSLASGLCIFALLVSNVAAAQDDAADKPAAKKAAKDKKDAKDKDTVKDAKPVAPAPEEQITGDPNPTAGSYMVQLKGLEQRVNELKERIFRSKARLNLLKETVLHGVIAGSRALILHKNDMGSSFRLEKLVYAVDGAQIYAKTDDSGGLDAKREFEIFNGSIVPGNHTVSVLMIFRGHGYGIFSYLKGYKFTVRSSHTFTAGEGKLTEITIRGFEKGNITTPLAERPAVDFKINVLSERPSAKK